MEMDISTLLGKASSLALADYVIVGISLGILLICGLYHVCFSGNGPEDFLLGGREMRTLPVAVSTALLYISALSIIDNPTDIYYNGIESFMASIVTVAAVTFGGFLFVPMFHKMQLTSVHQYLGHRFDSTVLRCITSLTFVLHQVVVTTVIMVLVGLALQRHFGVPLFTSILGIGIFATINATLGGFKTTVWTHAYQFLCITVFLILVVIFSASKAGGFRHAFDLAAEHGRLQLFNMKISVFMRHNTLNFIFGYGFIVLMDMATYQPVVQRYCSLPTRRAAIKSVFMSIPLCIIPSILCLLIGIFLQASYAGCDPQLTGRISDTRDLVPFFIREHMSYIPGITGAFIVCLAGGAISVFLTSLNSLTACTYQDFVSKLGWCKSPEERGHSICCRFICFGYGALCTLLTCLAVKYDYVDKLETFFSTSNIIIFNSVLYGPLAAVFLMAMFLPCINKYGAIIGFLGGVLCVGYVAVTVIPSTKTTAPRLPPIMGGCPNSALNMNETLLRFLPWHPKDDEELTADRLSSAEVQDVVTSLSYLLYALCGAIVTMLISFPVSILTCGFCVCAARKVPVALLHPLLSFSDCCIDSEERQLRQAISHRYFDRIDSVHNLFPERSRLDSKPPSYKYSSIPSTPASALS